MGTDHKQTVSCFKVLNYHFTIPGIQKSCQAVWFFWLLVLRALFKPLFKRPLFPHPDANSRIGHRTKNIDTSLKLTPSFFRRPSLWPCARIPDDNDEHCCLLVARESLETFPAPWLPKVLWILPPPHLPHRRILYHGWKPFT